MFRLFRRQAEAATALLHQQQAEDFEENENLALSCGLHNPRFLAKIRRCRAEAQQARPVELKLQ